MEKLEPTWGNSIPVWWSFFWRATVFGALAGALLGAIGGLIAGLMGRVDLASTVGGVAGYLIAIPVSMWCIKHLLNKKYNGYSVCLIKDSEE